MQASLLWCERLSWVPIKRKLDRVVIVRQVIALIPIASRLLQWGVVLIPISVFEITV